MMYLIPLGLTLVFWLSQDSSTWAGMTQRLGPLELLWFALATACGPLGWGVPPEVPWIAPVLFVILWTGWLTVACKTSRLRQLPYGGHLILGLIWCFCGCARTGLAIT